MAHLSPESPFQSWILTPKEADNGTILSISQKQCIQNQICLLSIQKNNLEFNPEHPMLFMQTEAEIRGQINALQYLIALSNEVESRITPGSAAIHIQDPQDPTS